MEEKTTKKIQEWVETTGKPAEEFAADIDKWKKVYADKVPGKDEAYYESLARRKINMDLARELSSRARPADVLLLGASSAFDTTRDEIAEKRALWANLETREQAVAEGKVARDKKDRQGNPIPDGTPLDTRQYFVPPDPTNPDDKGRKNPNFGEPLKQQFLRTIVGFGKPTKGGVMKLFAISDNRHATEPLPEIGQTYRGRLNLKDDTSPFVYYANTSVHTKWYPVTMKEFMDFDDEKICDLLASAPIEINPGLKGLMGWMEKYGENKQRLVVYEGDVKYMAPEPNENGSYMMILMDGDEDAADAEGITCFVPEDPLKPKLDFGIGSRVCGIARPNLGDAWDREERRPDPTRKVVNLAVDAIFAVPFLRVAPEEATMVEDEED